MRQTLAALICALLIATSPALVLAEDGPTWADRISAKGDFRLRYEDIDEAGEAGRSRWRYRARLAVTGQVSDNVKVVLELASGADNPVSRNVTLDGGFDIDDIGFDLAYFEWAATDDLTVYGGKMKNPLYRAGGSPLVWDGDLNPEGLALKYVKGAFFGNLGSFSVEERSSSSDSFLTAIQAGGKFAIADNLKLTAGVGFFAYSNTIGNEPFYNGSARGNSVDLNGNYLYDYRNTEVFAQLDTRVADLPLSVYVQWVRNAEVSEEDSGYAFGAKLGSAKAKGEWEAGWTYQDIEADSVIGTFNDSDFGDGGTDSSGHILKGKYVVAKNTSFAATYFINDVDRFQGTEHDYNRLQLDVQFNF
jgi:hypothetical protein